MRAPDDERGVLLVCRMCFKGLGKKDGWKRAAIREQLNLAEEACGLEVVKTGCLDVCPDKGVTAARVEDRRDEPRHRVVLNPKDTREETLGKLR